MSLEQLYPDWSKLFDDFPYIPARTMLEELNSEDRSEQSSELSEHFGAPSDIPRRLYLSIDDGTHFPVPADKVSTNLINWSEDYENLDYHLPERNIFVKMQSLDRLESRTCRTPLYKFLPTPDNLRLARPDAIWFEYFYHLALAWDDISVPRFVPGFLFEIYGLSFDHFALRQSLMSQAAGYYAVTNQTSLLSSRRYLAQLLPDVQTAISNLTFDVGHLCAVLQLVKIYSQLSDTMAAHRHLQGLRLMVDYLLAQPGDPHPLVMCVWRGALYFDIRFAFEGIPFAFPSPERGMDETHRKWLRYFIPSSKPELVEVVLAQFELDDIEHRVMSLLHHRHSSDYNPETEEKLIREGAEEALRDLRGWMRRSIIQRLESEEVTSRIANDEVDPDASFLHYPHLTFQNDKYALLLISYHSLIILTTLLTYPELGPNPPYRFASAVTICRILAWNMYQSKLAGITSAVHWHSHDLFRVGLVLGKQTHPEGITLHECTKVEFQWVIDRLREKKYPIALQMADSLLQAWESGESAMTVYGQRRRTTEREALVLEGPHEDISFEEKDI
jgi:hypothetical protein